MHTARHIVEHCLQGELANNRTMILVTHHISLCLSTAAYVVELSAGKIVLQGSVKDLQASGQLKTVIEEEDDYDEQAEEKEDIRSEDFNEADGVITDGKRPPKTPKSDGRLIEAEHREEGRVSLKTYLTYRTCFSFHAIDSEG
jgi:ABC-type multidrug transport system ATPase subunit